MTTRRQALMGGLAALTAAPLAHADPLGKTLHKAPYRAPIQATDTAVTAFVGRTPAGPLDVPTFCYGINDYLRTFGPLDDRFPMGQAVTDFFSNGGSGAFILRLFDDGGKGAGTARIVVGNLPLKAISPGAWGNGITAGIAANPLVPGGFFLTVTGNGRVEKYRISFSGSYTIDKVLADSSQLVHWDGDPPAADAQAVAADPAPLTGGSGGLALSTAGYLGDGKSSGINALGSATFNLLCVPADQPGGDTDATVYQAAHALCIQHRAVLIADAPAAWKTAADADLSATGLAGASNAAIYFPRLLVSDPLGGPDKAVVACGAIAGIYARNDAKRGVWTAPAGLTATLNGVTGLSETLTDAQASAINLLNVNALRRFNGSAPVVFGARTLSSWPEYRYVNVLRMSQFIENSVRAGLGWMPSAADDTTTWNQVRNLVTDFLMRLYQKGAFQGAKADTAFFVRCDATTTTADDLHHGKLNLLIGFAPLKPAEFVYVRITLQTRRA